MKIFQWSLRLTPSPTPTTLASRLTGAAQGGWPTRRGRSKPAIITTEQANPYSPFKRESKGWKPNFGSGIYILTIPLPPGGFVVPIEKRERIWRTIGKRKGKGGKRRKKEKSDKIHVKIPLYSLNYRKKSTKSGKNFRGGGGFFWLARIYIPVLNHGRNMHSWSSRIDHSMELVLDISPVLNWFPSFRCLLCLWNIFSFSLCQWIIVAFFSYKCCYFGSSGFSLNKRNAHFSLYNSKHALMKIIRVSNFNYIPLHFHHFFSQTIISNIVLEMSCQSEFLIQVVPEKNDLFTVYSLPSP